MKEDGWTGRSHAFGRQGGAAARRHTRVCREHAGGGGLHPLPREQVHGLEVCVAHQSPCMPRPCLWSETSGACARPGRMEHGGGEGAQSERARQRSTSAKVCGDCTFGALASSVQRLCLLPSRRYVRTWPPAGPTRCHGRLRLSSSDSRGGLRCGPLTGSWWRGGWTPRGSNRSSRCLSDKISNDTVLWPMQTASS